MRAAIVAITATMIVCVIGFTAAHERPEPKTHTVTMENMRFQPQSLTVAPGDTVVWVNKDLVPHTATSRDGVFDSKAIQAQTTWSFTARQKGDFAYICAFHPTMTATLLVR